MSELFLQRLTQGLIKLSTSEIPKLELDLIITAVCCPGLHSTVSRLSGEDSAKKKYNLLLAGNRFIDFNFSKQFKLF